MARRPPACTAFIAALFTSPANAAWAAEAVSLDLTGHGIGIAALVSFALAYALVISEEVTHLRKSKPVVLAAGVIWLMIAVVYAKSGQPAAVEQAARHTLLEYAELMLFLLVAMTYVNALEERGVFDALRTRLVRSGYSYRKLFWLTGGLAFCISPVADNLTTALVMCAVALAVGRDSPRFVALSCINIVVAANAGGAFSPFGDITTLMVWQKGIVDFWDFFRLFAPSVVNFVVPAAIMHIAVPDGTPAAQSDDIAMKPGARRIMLLFALTIVTAVCFHNFLHMPPVMGMMLGLAYLQFFGFWLKRAHGRRRQEPLDGVPFDVFRKIARAEWDTLLFFYGVMMCVSALGVIGYLDITSRYLYGELGATTANILIGLLSAILDNIPLMFAVLSMQPDMALGQWLLITLTAGVGGSLLSIGSAAGVALMGQARGRYTFFSHLKWTPAVALGYAASIAVHMALNADTF